LETGLSGAAIVNRTDFAFAAVPAVVSGVPAASKYSNVIERTG
jgi:hypothetical protein